MGRKVRPGSLAHAREALGRLQDLTGNASGVSHNDRDPNRQAKLQSILAEAFAVAYAGLNAEPLPPKVDHSKAI